MIAIYDFSILPFALGDILTWNVKQQVKALSMGEKFIDVFLCDDLPINLHQEKHVNSGNSKSHLTDLIPAFYTNPMIQDLHIFHKREEMLNCLFDEDLKSHQDKISKSREMMDANKTLFNEVSSHENINDYFKNNGNIPRLVSPLGFDPGRSEDFVSGKIVAIHLRRRVFDKTLETTETHRDADFKIWSDFILKAGEIHPDVHFFIMGKNADIFQLKNVIYPRVNGWTLAQELSLITRCNAFMGSCSGFAVMASFTKTPYLICKCDYRSYVNYGICFGKQHLPFATRHQFVSAEENVELLMEHLNRMI